METAWVVSVALKAGTDLAVMAVWAALEAREATSAADVVKEAAEAGSRTIALTARCRKSRKAALTARCLAAWAVSATTDLDRINQAKNSIFEILRVGEIRLSCSIKYKGAIKVFDEL